eukprot:scaffold58654_cov29-Tisochrysis_lutea.AAC.1
MQCNCESRLPVTRRTSTLATILSDSLVAARALVTMLEPDFSSTASAGVTLGITVSSVEQQPKASQVVILVALPPSSPPLAPPTSALSIGAIIGIAIGVAAAVAVLLAVVLSIYCRGAAKKGEVHDSPPALISTFQTGNEGRSRTEGSALIPVGMIWKPTNRRVSVDLRCAVRRAIMHAAFVVHDANNEAPATWMWWWEVECALPH